MKPIQQTFEDLRQTVNQTNIVWKFVFVFEIVVVVILGILSNKFETIDFTSRSFLLLLLFILLYILIKLFFLFTKKPLSNAPIEEVEAKYELSLYKKGISRINLINETISKSLHMLNDRTCYLTSKEYQESRTQNICEQNLQDGLSTVLSPFMKNISVILDTNNVKYTLGVFLEQFHHLDNENYVAIDDHIVVLNDDFDLGGSIPSKLFSINKPKGISLEIQTVLKKLFNNDKKYIEQKINADDKEFAMIASIIPCVCTGENNDGILFIIIEPLVDNLNDFSSTLNIFTRIITNWLSSYNECIYKKSREFHPEE